MKFTAITLFTVFFSLSTLAQISHGGEPFQWNQKMDTDIATYTLPSIDLEKYRNEDALNDQVKGIPFRFGANVPVDLDIHNSGTWYELENGDGIWRLALKSKGASSINFVFDAYNLPEGGKVFVYTEDKTQLLGSFTNENSSKKNTLGVGFVLAEKAIIEYHEPAAVKGEGYLHINNVTHGYRDILVDVESEEKGAFGNSGACNINVNCPEGLPFDFQKRSVAIIVVNNNGACTGAMVNNTSQDGTPYFLTANHCLGGDLDNWMFYFNHETSGCSGSNGPTNQSVSGATLLSSNAESDFALLELNAAPPSSYNVCYSGWDATDLEGLVTSAYGIHHPGGDVKKICFDDDAPYHATLGGFANQVWYVDQWENGVTEPGSSGSPLFNQSGLIIGQLAGGVAACSGTVNNGEHDFYGRLGVSWTFGNVPSNNISYWLDLANTGALIVPNSCGSSLPDLNASLGSITGIPQNICEITDLNSSINVVNLGVEPIESLALEVAFNGDVEIIEWNGNIPAQQNTFVSIGEFTPSDGTNTLTVSIVTINEEEDTDDLGNSITTTFVAFAEATEITVNIELDNFPEETSWYLEDAEGWQLASGGSYTDEGGSVSETFCIEDGCYSFVIVDSYGDGICCGQTGNGSYSVVDESGEELASGGEFGFSENTEICAVLDTQNFPNREFMLYPNPAVDILTIDAGKYSIEQVRIYDISGKLVANKSEVFSPRAVFNIAPLPSGLYVVEVAATDGFISREKVVVTKAE